MNPRPFLLALRFAISRKAKDSASRDFFGCRNGAIVKMNCKLGFFGAFSVQRQAKNASKSRFVEHEPADFLF